MRVIIIKGGIKTEPLSLAISQRPAHRILEQLVAQTLLQPNHYHIQLSRLRPRWYTLYPHSARLAKSAELPAGQEGIDTLDVSVRSGYDDFVCTCQHPNCQPKGEDWLHDLAGWMIVSPATFSRRKTEEKLDAPSATGTQLIQILGAPVTNGDSFVLVVGQNVNPRLPRPKDPLAKEPHGLDHPRPIEETLLHHRCALPA
jgi:hypothetical protein